MKISEMHVGMKISTRLLVSDSGIRKTKTNKNYLQLTLSDGTDTLDGKIWDYAHPAPPIPKLAYDVVGTIGEYMGKKQITVESLQCSDNQDMQDFEVVYMSDVSHLWQQVLRLIGSIDNKVIRDIVDGFYTTYEDRLKAATSAKGNHHVGFGGNLQHTYETALLTDKICRTMCEELKYEGYQINRDLAVAGALLHDVGKAWTYDQSTPAFEYNEDGRWFDHILLGIQMLTAWCAIHTTAEEQPYLRSLCHIIASHHGEPEKGSPVYPQFMEAMIVNYADGISAGLNCVLQLNRKADKEGKEVTDKNWLMGNHPMTKQANIL